MIFKIENKVCGLQLRDICVGDIFQMPDRVGEGFSFYLKIVPIEGCNVLNIAKGEALELSHTAPVIKAKEIQIRIWY